MAEPGRRQYTLGRLMVAIAGVAVLLAMAPRTVADWRSWFQRDLMWFPWVWVIFWAWVAIRVEARWDRKKAALREARSRAEVVSTVLEKPPCPPT